MTEQKLSDPPMLVALCREDDNGNEQVVGWAMLFPGRVVTYVPDDSGGFVRADTFMSLDSAERILGYSDIYPVGDLTTLPAPR